MRTNKRSSWSLMTIPTGGQRQRTLATLGISGKTAQENATKAASQASLRDSPSMGLIAFNL